VATGIDISNYQGTRIDISNYHWNKNRYFQLPLQRECCCMLVIVLRQQGRLDCLCFVSQLNDVPGSVYMKVRDPLLVAAASFSFWCDLFDDHGACSANMW